MSTTVKLTNATDLNDLLLKIDRSLIQGGGLTLDQNELTIIYSLFKYPSAINKGNSIDLTLNTESQN